MFALTCPRLVCQILPLTGGGQARVGPRSLHLYCAHISGKDRAPKARSRDRMAMLVLGRSLRPVCRWQGLYSKIYRYIPVRVEDDYHQLKESNKTRGNIQYWDCSAERIGLVNMVDDRTMGIYFATPPCYGTLSSEWRIPWRTAVLRCVYTAAIYLAQTMSGTDEPDRYLCISRDVSIRERNPEALYYPSSLQLKSSSYPSLFNMHVQAAITADQQ
jgi:hypothetical protein